MKQRGSLDLDPLWAWVPLVASLEGSIGLFSLSDLCPTLSPSDYILGHQGGEDHDLDPSELTI